MWEHCCGAEIVAETLTTDPGTLNIADRVGEKIAVRAALDVDGVVRHQTSLGSMLSGATPGRAVAGGDYPQATVDMSVTAPSVRLTIAVRWPCRLTDVCRQVRGVTADELARLTGVRPGRVDVTVAAVLSGPVVSADRTGPGFVELPAPQPAPADEEVRS
ncbi:Asp23/Gls24 family envelope stress response protein [Streptomyces sp. SID6673]|nr:Asp23/Gls24 family envelope stress response protein [Streptomyces sp. SID11726]NEB25383.1 Asp23/Gls24 family envelope stress response protein [Streptomyces sp. SID6673]